MSVKTHHNSIELFLGPIFLGFILPVIGSVFSILFIPEYRWENIPLHAVLEGTGGSLALIIAGFWWLSKRSISKNSPWFWLSCGLIVMGLLDIFHAIVHPGQNFVWLHSIANFMGGGFFAGAFISRWVPIKFSPNYSFLSVLVGAFLLGFVSISYPHWVPIMVENGSFTFLAKGLNIIGGVGFFLAAWTFVQPDNKYFGDDSYLISIHCSLLGSAGILFELSTLWDGAWWWWHILRLLAYGASFIVILKTNQVAFRHLEQKNRYTQKQLLDANESLKISEERLSLAVEGSNNGLWDWDLLNNTVYYSPKFIDLLNYTDREEFPSTFESFESHLHVDDHDSVMKLLEQHLKDNTPYDIEFRLRMKSGEYRWFRAKGKALRDSECTAYRIAGSISDIHDRILQEQKLKSILADNILLGSVLQHSLNEIYIFDTITLKFLRANKGAKSNLGFTNDEIKALTPIDIKPEISEHDFIALIEPLLSGEKDKIVFETVHQRKDKTLYAVEVHLQLGIFQAKKIFLAIVLDVTKRKNLEHDYELILNNVPATIFYKDNKNTILRLNKMAAETIGLPIAAIEGQPSEKFFPEMAEMYFKDDLEVINSGKPKIGYIEFYKPEGGEAKWIRTDKVPYFDDKGNAVGVVVISFDVTAETQLSEKLKISENKFRAIFNQTYQFTGLMDLEGTLIEANQSSLDASGVRAEDVLHKPFWETVWWSHSSKLQEELKIAVEKTAQGEFVRIDATHLAANGELIYVDFSLKPAYNNENEIIYLIPEGRDITELKRTEKQLEDIKNAIDHSSIVAITNLKGVITYANDAFSIVSGYKKEEFLGKTHNIVNSGYHPKEFFQSMWDTILSGQVWRGEVKNKAKDGSCYWVDTTITPFLDSNKKPFQFVAIRNEITDRKTFESQLQESNEELEKFAYIASHDLQEPLRKVQTYCDFLENECSEQLNDDGRKYVKRLITSTTRMRGLINDLLNYSRVNSSKKPFEKIQIKKLIDSVLDDLIPLVAKHDGKIHLLDLPETLYGDPLQMRQLFQNLITNALKFHKEGVSPEIKIFGQKNPDGILEISVKDNGIGFEEEYKDRIFEVFQRLHGRGEFEGTGIGLSICQKIVQRHEGIINVESSLGKGTTFKIKIPSGK